MALSFARAAVVVVLASVHGFSARSWAQNADAGKTDGSDTIRDVAIDSAKEQRDVTLLEMLVLALKQNLDIRVEGYGPLLEGHEITRQRSVFDPVFFAGLERQERLSNTTPDDDPYTLSSHLKDVTLTHRGGLRKRMLTGGTLQLELRQTRTQSFPQRTPPLDPRLATSATLSLTQPLLRQAGLEVNRIEIFLAENARDVSVYQFSRVLIETATSVELRYLDLIRARSNYQVARTSLDVAETLYRKEVSRARGGASSKIDELTFLTGVVAGQEQLVVSRKAVYDAEDALKNLVAPADGALREHVELRPRESLQDLEAMVAQPTQLAVAVATALQQRPDLLAARAELNSAHLRALRSKNALLPQLDLTGSFAYDGGRSSHHDSWAELGELRYYTWVLGLSFEFPLGNRAARAAYAQSRLRQQQQQQILERSEAGVITEVRRTYRAFETALERKRLSDQLEATRKDLFQKRLLLVDAGTAAIFETEQDRREYVQAQSNAINARVELLQTLAQIRQACGTTIDYLERLGIAVLQETARNESTGQ